MFIYSIKPDKKKAIIIILAAAIIICALILLAGRRDSGGMPTSASGSDAVTATDIEIGSEKDVAEYLKSLGWEISDEPVDVQNIIIPREFSDKYEDYNEIQKKQGYDLSKYSGIDAVRYTYEIFNYPDQQGGVVADILVVDKNIIAADIQSVKLNGFMHELRENKVAESYMELSID